MRLTHGNLAGREERVCGADDRHQVVGCDSVTSHTPSGSRNGAPNQRMEEGDKGQGVKQQLRQAKKERKEERRTGG